MTKSLFVLAVVLMLAGAEPCSAAAQPHDLHAALEVATAELKGTLTQVSELDEAEKRIKLSNRAQTENAKALDGTREKLKKDMAAWEDRVQRYNARGQAARKSGCSFIAGMVTQEEAARCKPMADELNAEHDAIEQAWASLDHRVDLANEVQRAINKTRQENAQSQNVINERRREQQALSLRQHEALSHLQASTITQALLDGLATKSRASAQCMRLQDTDQKDCCNSVIWEGTDPQRCDTNRLFDVFLLGGIVGSVRVFPK
jgi:DNA repair exonuclease SbcCD ATPase subunit